MKYLIPLAAAALMMMSSATSAKTVTYVETVTRADGSKVITYTTVKLPTAVTVTRASLQQSVLRFNLR